ncbi:M23 family metallopeptidase [Streptomyces hainanensis]|uniref:M23 family metallopeptidase n=1 Tax=Streptomyces hainanensis TaxID=402648 RepID=A0A4R4T9A3_9ACTN|nr:M23 family metallopeptidase [Streptomyces hainanensis]TDC73868.1 M23 family metallopeptidase [Streptomyces hainanensis]
MSDRLLSGVTDQHSDHPGYGSYAAYDVLDPYGAQPTGHEWGGAAQGQPQGGYEGTAGVGEWPATADGQWVAEQQQAATATIPPQQGVQDWYLQQSGGWDNGYGAGDLHGTPAQGVPAYQEYQEYQEPRAQEYEGAYGAAYGPEFHQAQPEAYGAEYGEAAVAEEPAVQPDPGPDQAPDEAAHVTEEWAGPEAVEPPAEPAEAGAEAAPAVTSRGQGRSRRRVSRPRARSAFLSVAAPSLAVLGVTAVATAATVSGTESDSVGEPPPVAAPDPADEAQRAEANAEFDTQLTSVSAAAGDYADRASRTQGRIDLVAQQEAEEQAAAEEAARIEAARPKFSVPVEQRGLSAYYGQAGVNWMSTHTGIDFPVSYGTPVLAASDGTIRTQWHPSYGNLAILTADDGTETWYAHLDSTAYQSGYVQAGTVIAYSGNSGNSTGPHLHFEVHPGGGSAIDPLTWLRNQGLEPT